MDARTILAVAVGAALGGVLRLTLTQAVVARFGSAAAPYATMFINVSGSFAIGLVVELCLQRSGIEPALRAFLAVGVLGGYTTFSTFSYEALGLFSEGLALRAALYVVGSVVLSVGATLAGIWSARAIS